jgi:MFS family permease
MLGCIILSIGAALQTAAFGISQMIVGRIVAGLGNGMNTSTIRKQTEEPFGPIQN